MDRSRIASLVLRLTTAPPVAASLARPALAAVAAALLLAGAAAAQDYALRPGDQLRINFYTAAGEEIREITGERNIDRNGNIFLPYVGTLQVSGMDAAQIRDVLADRYSAYYDNPVVDVLAFLRVSITGSVGRPGNYYVDPSSTLIDVLATAGGATPDVTLSQINIPSDPSRVRLVRDGETQILDLRPDQVTAEIVNLRVQSGDWIYVPTEARSQLRDDLLFLGSILSVISTTVLIITLLNN